MILEYKVYHILCDKCHVVIQDKFFADMMFLSKNEAEFALNAICLNGDDENKIAIRTKKGYEVYCGLHVPPNYKYISGRWRKRQKELKK